MENNSTVVMENSLYLSFLCLFLKPHTANDELNILLSIEVNVYLSSIFISSFQLLSSSSLGIKTIGVFTTCICLPAPSTAVLK